MKAIGILGTLKKGSEESNTDILLREVFDRLEKKEWKRRQHAFLI